MNVILNAVLEVRVVAIGNLHSKIVVTQHLLCLYNIGCGTVSFPVGSTQVNLFTRYIAVEGGGGEPDSA